MTIRAHRFAAAGALAVAAVAVPIAIALTSSTAAEPVAGCLAWFGNQEDGVCLSYSNGNGYNVGTPFGVYGPNGGFTTSPLLPSQSWTVPIG